MPELSVDAIIFDMDGVVIDSGDVYERHWRRWGERHGIDYEAAIAHVHPGRPPVETIRTVAPHLDARAEADRFNASLDVGGDGEPATPMPGALELLHTLPAGRWAIATSAARAVAPIWLGQAGLPIPDALVTVDDIEHGKPAPDPFLRAAEMLGVDPTRCLVVEDAPAGITGAKAAGAAVLALRTTHGPDDLAEADHQTVDLSDVRATLESGALVVRWRAPD